MLGIIIKHIYVLILIAAGYGAYESYLERENGLLVQQTEISNLKNVVKKKQIELTRLDKYYQDVDHAIENIKLVMSQIKDLQSRLPSVSDDLTNLQTIKNIGKLINIRNVELSPEREQKKDFYYVTKYNFKASGTYLQFLLLLEQISKGKRMLNIPAIEFREMVQPQKGRYVMINANITIESYRYNSKYEDSGDVVGDITSKYSDIIKRKTNLDKKKEKKK